MERLNKVLARAGVASRRAADRMIAEGRVTVNGAVVSELGTKIDVDRDAVKVDGKLIGGKPVTPVYFMLNKPRGMVTTLSDPEGRPTIKDLIHGVRGRVYPVGRLDFNSEGLLLLTNDGDLARDLMHPGKGVPKVYATKVRGTPDEATLDRLRRGIRIDGRLSRPIRVRLLRRGGNSWLEVTVTEGRKHLVRRLLEAVGHPVVRLRRTGFGGLDLSDLPPGELRRLTTAECSRLRRAVGSGSGSRRPPRSP